MVEPIKLNKMDIEIVTAALNDSGLYPQYDFSFYRTDQGTKTDYHDLDDLIERFSYVLRVYYNRLWTGDDDPIRRADEIATRTHEAFTQLLSENVREDDVGLNLHIRITSLGLAIRLMSGLNASNKTLHTAETPLITIIRVEDESLANIRTPQPIDCSFSGYVELHWYLRNFGITDELMSIRDAVLALSNRKIPNFTIRQNRLSLEVFVVDESTGIMRLIHTIAPTDLTIAAMQNLAQHTEPIVGFSAFYTYLDACGVEVLSKRLIVDDLFNLHCEQCVEDGKFFIPHFRFITEGTDTKVFSVSITRPGMEQYSSFLPIMQLN